MPTQGNAGLVQPLKYSESRVKQVVKTANPICTATTDHSGVLSLSLDWGAGAYAVKRKHQITITIETDMQTVNTKQTEHLVEVVFRNYPYGSLLITKWMPWPINHYQCHFQVTTGDGTVVGKQQLVCIHKTVMAEILIQIWKPGSYVVTERIAPEGYACDTKPQTIEIGYRWCYIKVHFRTSLCALPWFWRKTQITVIHCLVPV